MYILSPPSAPREMTATAAYPPTRQLEVGKPGVHFTPLQTRPWSSVAAAFPSIAPSKRGPHIVQCAGSVEEVRWIHSTAKFLRDRHFGCALRPRQGRRFSAPRRPRDPCDPPDSAVPVNDHRGALGVLAGTSVPECELPGQWVKTIIWAGGPDSSAPPHPSELRRLGFERGRVDSWLPRGSGAAAGLGGRRVEGGQCRPACESFGWSAPSRVFAGAGRLAGRPSCERALGGHCRPALRLTRAHRVHDPRRLLRRGWSRGQI